MSKVGKGYSREFKLEAIKLAESIGAAKASEELGVTRKSIQNWMNGKSLSKPKSLSQTSDVSELEAEVRRLKKENKNLKLINEVLKKSTAIFSKDQLGD
jgi:transposase